MSEGALGRQRAVGTGQGFIPKGYEQRLSSAVKAVDQGGCWGHLEPNMSKGKTECKVFGGMRELNPG